jgi:hypothetical protein
MVQDSLATLSRIELGAFGQIYVAVIPRLPGIAGPRRTFPSRTAPRLPRHRFEQLAVEGRVHFGIVVRLLKSRRSMASPRRGANKRVGAAAAMLLRQIWSARTRLEVERPELVPYARPPHGRAPPRESPSKTSCCLPRPVDWYSFWPCLGGRGVSETTREGTHLDRRVGRCPVLTSISTKFDQVVQSPHGPRFAALITFARGALCSFAVMSSGTGHRRPRNSAIKQNG